MVDPHQVEQRPVHVFEDERGVGERPRETRADSDHRLLQESPQRGNVPASVELPEQVGQTLCKCPPRDDPASEQGRLACHAEHDPARRSSAELLCNLGRLRQVADRGLRALVPKFG